jgi:hypothetical protein
LQAAESFFVQTTDDNFMYPRRTADAVTYMAQLQEELFANTACAQITSAFDAFPYGAIYEDQIESS